MAADMDIVCESKRQSEFALDELVQSSPFMTVVASAAEAQVQRLSTQTSNAASCLAEQLH